MWWLVWVLCYLGLGSCIMGIILSIAVKNGKFDPENPELFDLIGCVIAVVIWPLVVCLIVTMGIAYAAKSAKKEATKP